MTTPVCSQCKKVIPAEDINVGADVAYCRVCNISHSLAALTSGMELDARVDLSNPPPGAWHVNDGTATTIGATHRSVAGALGALVFGLFWNGIVSIFVLVVSASTLKHFGVTLPEWFPAPNMNGQPMGVGMTIFMWIFLTPFIVIGLIMIGTFFSCLMGRTEVRISREEGTVFTGLGKIGWRRRFTPGDIKQVRIDDRRWRDSDGDSRRKSQIVMETARGKLIRFGGSLSAERRKFVASAVRQARSKRSRFITLFHTSTKSCRNFSWESSHP